MQPKSKNKEPMIIRAVVDIHADGDVYIKNGKRFSLIGTLVQFEAIKVVEFPNRNFLRARKLIKKRTHYGKPK